MLVASALAPPTLNAAHHHLVVVVPAVAPAAPLLAQLVVFLSAHMARVVCHHPLAPTLLA